MLALRRKSGAGTGSPTRDPSPPPPPPPKGSTTPRAMPAPPPPSHVLALAPPPTPSFPDSDSFSSPLNDFQRLLSDLDAQYTLDGYRPQTKRECLTRHVFPTTTSSLAPLLTAPLPPPSLAGADLEQALERLRLRPATARIRIQYHAALSRLLYTQSERIHVESNHPQQTNEQRQWAELDALVLRAWTAKCAQHAAAHSPAHRTGVPSLTVNHAFAHFVEPLNDFLSSAANFKAGRAPRGTSGWLWPSSRDASDAAGDWVAWGEGRKRGVLKWKHAGVSLDEGDLASAQQGACAGAGAIDVHKGFEVWRDERTGAVRNSGGVSVGGAEACLLAWSDSHHYRTRWTIVFDGATALVCYLAKPDTVFVGDLIRASEDGREHDALTLALAMFAVCTLGSEERPSVSMSDEAMMWYSKPARVPVFVVDGMD